MSLSGPNDDGESGPPLLVLLALLWLICSPIALIVAWVVLLTLLWFACCPITLIVAWAAALAW